MVNFHPNIIQFCGITKLKGKIIYLNNLYLFTLNVLFTCFYTLDETNYSLVLEYAEGGTLRKYLRDSTVTFKWENQLKFAKEIASVISWLHVDKGIIHGDLVSILY